MIIAVTGATGHLGRLVIDQLKQKVDADNIVALARTRSPEKAGNLGVAVRAADYGKHTARSYRHARTDAFTLWRDYTALLTA